MNKWVKRGATGVLVLAACGTVGGSAYWYWLQTPPPLPTTAAQAVDLFRSPRFQRLAQERQDPYLDQTRKLIQAMPQEERRELIRQVGDDPRLREAAREAMANQFMLLARNFAQTDELKRRQLVDAFIGMQELFKLRSTLRSRGGDAGATGWGGRRGGSGGSSAATASDNPAEEAARQARRQDRRAQQQEWIQDKIEQGNPQRQAYIGEIFKAVRDRRVEMGLEPWPSFPQHGQPAQK